MRPDPALIGWYYKRGEQRIGPLSVEEVARHLATRQLQPMDMLVEIAEMTGPAGPGVRYSYLDAASVAAKKVAARTA